MTGAAVVHLAGRDPVVAVDREPGVPGVFLLRLGRRGREVADLVLVLDGVAPRRWVACGDILVYRRAGSPEHAEELIAEAVAKAPGAEAVVCRFLGGWVVGVPGSTTRRWFRPGVPAEPAVDSPLVAFDGLVERGRPGISHGGVEFASPGEVVACLLIVASGALDVPERCADFRGVVRRIQAFDDFETG